MLVFLLVIMYLPLTGTDLRTASYDTLKLVEGTRIIMPGGSRIKIDKDTTLIIHSELPYKIRFPRGDAGHIFFDSLEHKADRSNWSQQLHDIVITEPKNPNNTDSIITEVSSSTFISHGGKFIRSIKYTILEPFGPSIFDTSGVASTQIEKFANDMHRVTQDRVINNHLLFQQGDILDPNEFADNERVLRELPFVQDVRIHIIDAQPGSDSVDVLILVKDNFSIGVGGALYDYDAGRANIFDKNLFGLGHELHMVFHWDGQRSPWLGNEIFYIVNNMGGSFINAKLRYAQIFESETYELEFTRRFFTPDIKWAGAFQTERSRVLQYINYADTAGEFMTVKFNIYDAWVGRSFYLKSQNKFTRNRLNLVVATRLFRNHFIDRPEVTETNFYPFQNRLLWLNSFSISSQSFFRSNLIRDFGRTEDVPQGMLFTLTSGYEFGEFNNRLYTGLSLSMGGYIRNFGYLHGQLEGGGFLNEFSFIQQGVINAKVNYFSPLFIINRFKFRHFVNAQYVRGIRRFQDEFLRINNIEGIRGFRTDLPAGQQKVVLNYEVDAFTPFYLYGFRFVMFGFADVGMIGPEYKKWHDGAFFSGLGLGVRIRNERLVFETITIRLGYYPNHPEKDFPLFIDLYGEDRLNPELFYVRKPDIIGFD